MCLGLIAPKNALFNSLYGVRYVQGTCEGDGLKSFDTATKVSSPLVPGCEVAICVQFDIPHPKQGVSVSIAALADTLRHSCIPSERHRRCDSVTVTGTTA